MIKKIAIKMLRYVKKSIISFARSRIDKKIDKTKLKEIPVIINNRNRFACLKQLINRLEVAGMKNIYILDNDSSYPPLLEYYRSIPYRVFFLQKNLGFTALWDSTVFRQFCRSYYIYTDPDVVPIDACPDDFVHRLFEVLEKYPFIDKVGLGLRIDDLPDHYARKDQVIEWESKFWQKEVEKDLYDADVDTTFALYRPFAKGPAWECRSFRTAGKHMAHHLPWYEDSGNLSEETVYYQNTLQRLSTVWSKTPLVQAVVKENPR